MRPQHVLRHLLVPWEMLANPRHAASWLEDRFSTAGPAAQGLPWIAWPCVDFLTRYLQPSHRVFEWGGGGSTLFFLKKGCRVTTVESDATWVQQLRERIRELGADAESRWDLRFVPLVDNADPAIADYVRQVETGAPWDVVMVDGWSRLKCLLAGLSRGETRRHPGARQRESEAVRGCPARHAQLEAASISRIGRRSKLGDADRCLHSIRGVRSTLSAEPAADAKWA